MPEADRPSHWPRPLGNAGEQRDWIVPVERILAARVPVAVVALFGGIVALLASFAIPAAYTASASFVPESRQGQGVPAGLAGLAGQFGVPVGSGNSESPEFYARLLNSRQLRLAVVMTDVGGQTLVDYYEAGGRTDSIERTIRALAGDYSVSVDRLTRIVRLDVELHSPQLAKTVAERFLSAVQDFNLTIRQRQASARRAFVEKQFSAAADSLRQAEGMLRDFLTRNRTVDAPVLQFERGRLERRVTTAQEVYMALARELQQARIDEVNDTPLISVIDPPVLPVRRSSPNRPVSVLVGLFFGTVTAVALSLWRPEWWRRRGG